MDSPIVMSNILENGGVDNISAPCRPEVLGHSSCICEVSEDRCIDVHVCIGLPYFRVWRSSSWPLKNVLRTTKNDHDESHKYTRKRESGIPPGLSNFLTDSVEDYPLGYPRVSAFLDSSPDLAVYRRFGILHSRVLLHKQDQLRNLEAELDWLDLQDWRGTDQTRKTLMSRSKNNARKDDAKDMRNVLLDDIEKKLLEYGTRHS